MQTDKAGSVEALIFDMDGTMIDSMPYHTQSWVEFTRRQDNLAYTHICFS